MIYNRLGSSGLAVSALSIGPWNTISRDLDTNKAKSLIKYAFDHGVNYFDNAEKHANGLAEVVMGEALAGLPREQIVVGTKIFWGGNTVNEVGLSRKHIVEGLHRSLKHLALDYLDITFCHRDDPNTPLQEIAFTFDNLIRQGKTLYWGISEWSADRINQLLSVCDKYQYLKPICIQSQYHLLCRQRVETEYAQLIMDGLGIMAYSPLYFGILSGKYLNSIPKDSRLAIDKRLFPENLYETNAFVSTLQEIATSFGLTSVQLAIAWVLKNPNINTALTGFKTFSQFDESISAISLSKEILDEAFGLINERLSLYQEIITHA